MLFHKSKTVIIVGASRFGAGLAGKPSGPGVRIVVVDLDADAFRKLPEVFSRLNDSNKERLVRGYDIVIALRDKDADNLEICQMAKRLFGIKKTVCTVRNPKNVEVFELLGVDRAISATYMLAHYIEQASVVEELVGSCRWITRRC